MTDIGHRNIEDYLRDLISEGFGQQAEDSVDCDDQPAEGSSPDRSSSEHPDQPPPPRRGSRDAAREGRPVARDEAR